MLGAFLIPLFARAISRECCSKWRVELQNREVFPENVALIGVLSNKKRNEFKR